MNPRRPITAALLAALALAIAAACTAEAEPAPAITVTETAEPPEPTLEPEPVEEAPEPEPVEEPVVDDAVLETALVQLLHDEYPADMAGEDDADVIEAAHLNCDALDQGLSFYDVVSVGADSGFSTEFSAFFVGASVGAFCPEHQGEIPGS